MSDVIMMRQRIKPGKTDRLASWIEELQEERPTGETSRETCGEPLLLNCADGDDFLIAYMDADDLDESLKSFRQSSDDLDQKHREILAETVGGEENSKQFELFCHLTSPHCASD